MNSHEHNLRDRNELRLAQQDDGQVDAMVRTEAKITGVSIIIEDYATQHRPYAIREYVRQYLQFVPKDDLPEKLTVRLFDTVPSHVPNKNACAAFYPESKTTNGVWIDIYLSECLGYFPKVSDKHQILGVWLNKAFLLLFGRFFLAAGIFHEIGHLKYSRSSSVDSRSGPQDEEEAVQYENVLLRSAFPLSQRHYTLFNWIYKILYGKRISAATSVS